MLYHGPVRVPADARPGPAKITVDLPAGCGYSSDATDISLKLVKETAANKERQKQ